METILHPGIFGSEVSAFFTGKIPGAEPRQVGALGSVSREHVYLPVQRHTDKVHILGSRKPRIADAVITKEKGIMIGIQSADCVPLLLFDSGHHAIAAVHAGWRGTAKGILKKTLEALSGYFSSSPSDIRIAIGPSIRSCCYEVSPDVRDAVHRQTGQGDYSRRKGDKYLVDLASANRHQALSCGIPSGNIWMSGDCTFCNPDKYHSYRYAGGPAGRQGGFIILHKEGQ